MHDYESFERLHRCIRNEEDDCRRCPKCYRARVKTLFFNTSRSTDIMFISESPNDYPNPQEGVYNSEDFIGKVLQRRLKTAAQANRPQESKPQDIFDFIYNTFRPVFDEKTQGSWAEAFLQTVYWTHAGKKSFKSFSEVKKENAARQCADRLLREELRAILPSLVIMASSIASRVLLGRGYADLFRQQERAGSFLSLEEQWRPGSLFHDTLESEILRGNWKCRLAVFPNPSPRNGFWKKCAYETRATSRIISDIHMALEARLKTP